MLLTVFKAAYRPCLGPESLLLPLHCMHNLTEVNIHI